VAVVIFAILSRCKGCTAKTTSYCANIAGGLMLGQFTKHLRNLPVDPDIQLNLLTSEITVSP